jgi:hypothetical protein
MRLRQARRSEEPAEQPSHPTYPGGVFDSWIEPYPGRMERLPTESLVRLVSLCLTFRAVVVEVKAGDGELVRRLAPFVKRVIAVDPAGSCEDWPKNAQPVRSVGERIPLGDRSVSLVVTHGVLWPDLFRVLAPGGTLVCLVAASQGEMVESVLRSQGYLPPRWYVGYGAWWMPVRCSWVDWFQRYLPLAVAARSQKPHGGGWGTLVVN